MSNASISFEAFEKELLQDEEVRTEYENLKPRYEIISQMIKIRNEEGITQEELARRIGTKKSNISRMESGNYNPSLDFLVKIANGLGRTLNIQMNR